MPRSPDAKVLRFLPGSDAFLAADAKSGALMKCTLRTWGPGPRIGKGRGFSALARRKDGELFGLNLKGDTLYRLDAATGVASRIGKLTMGRHAGRFADSAVVRHVRGLTFSDQPHELWGVLPNSTLPNQRTDAIVRIDTATAQIDRLHLLNRCDVLSIACPPRAGGPWNGITKFIWCATGGLYGLKWANQDDEMIRLGAPTDGGQVRDMCFSRDGKLFGIGITGLSTINTEHGTVTPVLSLASIMGGHAEDCTKASISSAGNQTVRKQQLSLDGLVWLPFNPSSKMFAAPAPSAVAKRIDGSKGSGQSPSDFNLLSSIGVDIDSIKPSRERHAPAIDSSAITVASASLLRRRRSSTFGKLSFAQRMRLKTNSQDVYHEDAGKEEEKNKLATPAVPLAANMWVEARAPSGRSYWWRRDTRETTWEQPREPQPPPPPPPPPKQPHTQLADGTAIAKSPDMTIDRFLRGLGLPQYVADFEREEITLAQLRDLTVDGRGDLDSALKSLGMTKMGQRLKMWMALRE